MIRFNKKLSSGSRAKHTPYDFSMEVVQTIEVVSEVDVETSVSAHGTSRNVAFGRSTYGQLLRNSPTITHPKDSLYRDEYDESEYEQQYIRFDDDNDDISLQQLDDCVETATDRNDALAEEMLLPVKAKHKIRVDKKNPKMECKSEIKVEEEIEHKPVLIKKGKETLDVTAKSEVPLRDRTYKVYTNSKKSKCSSTSLKSGDSKKVLLGPDDSVVSIEDVGSSIKSEPVVVVVRNMTSERPVCEPLHVSSGRKTTITTNTEKLEMLKKTDKRNVLKTKEAKGNVFPKIQTKDVVMLKCVLCQKECINKNALIEHVKSHSSDKKSFECPTCRKIFTQQCNLKRHMRCHSGERPFSCSYCKKLFADQGYLTTHLRYHTNTKPYTCQHCSKPFFDRSNYVKHLKSHSGEKPYPCPICKKSFLQQSDLTRHTRVHSGERPFKCGSCDRSFTQHGDLTTHLRHHTGERPFICSHCGKTFANKRYLNGHIKGQICLKKKVKVVSDIDKLSKLLPRSKIISLTIKK